MPIQSFLRTPAPQPREGLMAYILRLTQANHYASPWRVLSVAGYSQDEMFRPTLEPKRLAARLGQHGGKLASMAMFRGGVDGGRTFLIGTQSLGRSLKHSPYRLDRPAICPQCVLQDGFGRQSWDLAAVSACPRHQCRLLHMCAVCSTPLTWFRRGLLQCACGANLARQFTDEADPAEVEVAQLLERRIDGDSTAGLASGTGLPIESLNALPFDILIKLIQTLHRLRPQNWNEQDSPGLTAAKVFAGWPHAFHQYLRDKAASSRQLPATVALRRRFEPLYLALFKRCSVSSHLGFLREAFVNFGLREWGEALVDPKMHGSAGCDRRFVSAAAFAQRAGVRPITVRRWVAQGRLAGSITPGRSVRGFVVDVSRIDGEQRPLSERLEARVAGKYIGLPVTVLRQLKASGHYSTNPAVNAVRGFWKIDLDILGKRIIECATNSSQGAAMNSSRSDCVLLGDVLGMMKFGDRTAKGRLLASLLDGQTNAVGRAPKHWQQLRLSAAEVERFRISDAMTRPAATMSRQAAAAMLHVGVYAIPALLKSGLLRKPQGKGVGVDRESVVQFQQDWRLLSDLASELRLKSSTLIAEAQRRRLKVKSLPVAMSRSLLNA